MMVGEQPGDNEDIEGAPFVGPAGRILDEALEAAGIDREAVFITNVVKHFKWRPTPGSKRRLHERPNRIETAACLPWLESELALVRPEVLVLLGATAAQALVGDDVRVTRDHGRPLHPSIGGAPLTRSCRTGGRARGDDRGPSHRGARSGVTGGVAVGLLGSVSSAR
jgi:DNA polymerase